jgi:hypothetical protein
MTLHDDDDDDDNNKTVCAEDHTVEVKLIWERE